MPRCHNNNIAPWMALPCYFQRQIPKFNQLCLRRCLCLRLCCHLPVKQTKSYANQSPQWQAKVQLDHFAVQGVKISAPVLMHCQLIHLPVDLREFSEFFLHHVLQLGGLGGGSCEMQRCVLKQTVWREGFTWTV
ncbi:hypothetical protein ACLKA7_014917 [Drosophila subpalustris]